MSDVDDAASTGSNLSAFWDELIANEENEEMFRAEAEAGNDTSSLSSRKDLSIYKKAVSLVTCHKCKRKLNTIEGYKNHLKIHIVEDLYLSAPGRCSVVMECRSKSESVIRMIADRARKLCGTAESIVELTEYLLSLLEGTRNIFVDCVANELWSCIPRPSKISLATFHGVYVQCTGFAAIDDKKRNSMFTCLKEIAPLNMPDSVLQLFVDEFFPRLCKQVEAFYLKSVREPREVFLFESRVPLKSPRDDPEDVEFQQTVHYIGGSVVRSIFKVAHQSNKPMWKNIVRCVSSKLLAGPLASAPEAEVVAWTEAQNRGGLQFISDSMWTFLMSLSGILVNIEAKDGSVPHKEVLDFVKADDMIMMLWSDVVGECLPLADSEFLLREVCRLYVNTWGQGVAQRVKNAIPRQSRDKLPLRSTLLKK